MYYMSQTVHEAIQSAVNVLKEAGAKEIYLFGSAAKGTDTSDSDIDLAVKGLPAEAFFETVGKVALAISRGFDIVDMDEPNPFVEYLETKGELRRVA
jgi:predicted nucleotidyltransferase